MLPRIITAAIGLPILIALVFYRGGVPFAFLTGALAVIGVLEFYAGVRKTGIRPRMFLGAVAVAIIIRAGFMENYSSAAPFYAGTLTLLLVLTLVLELLRMEKRPLAGVGATVFGAMYVGWLLSYLVRIRSMPGEMEVLGITSEKGAWLVVFVILVTWACDTGAYFSGRSLGKRKLAPKLSPAKTVEGSIGGLVSAASVAVLLGLLLRMPIDHALILGGLMGVFGQLGDLVESSFKREIGIKDFGSILPGHGGALDRFDSLLFTGPLVYYYVIWLL